MQTLLLVSASAFVIGALTWFSVWAFWIHPPEGWLGKEIVSVTRPCETEEVRHAAWFRWLKTITVLLGLITVTALATLVAAHPW